MANRNLIVRGGADFSGFRRGISEAQNSLKSFQSNVKGIFAGIAATLAAVGIGSYIKDSVSEASELESAMLGLRSIIEGQGKSFSKAQSFINDYIKDGLVPLTDAVTGYKNLAARGYNDEQIQQTMERLKDAAAFGRQASYSLGEAVASATEGLKNENSILVNLICPIRKQFLVA